MKNFRRLIYLLIFIISLQVESADNEIEEAKIEEDEVVEKKKKKSVCITHEYVQMDNTLTFEAPVCIYLPHGQELEKFSSVKNASASCENTGHRLADFVGVHDQRMFGTTLITHRSELKSKLDQKQGFTVWNNERFTTLTETFFQLFADDTSIHKNNEIMTNGNGGTEGKTRSCYALQFKKGDGLATTSKISPPMVYEKDTDCDETEDAEGFYAVCFYLYGIDEAPTISRTPSPKMPKMDDIECIRRGLFSAIALPHPKRKNETVCLLKDHLNAIDPFEASVNCQRFHRHITLASLKVFYKHPTPRFFQALQRAWNNRLYTKHLFFSNEYYKNGTCLIYKIYIDKYEGIITRKLEDCTQLKLKNIEKLNEWQKYQFLPNGKSEVEGMPSMNDFEDQVIHSICVF
ncbi:hypothetical protein SNEBB_011260 [Seison nebaliae]|nr:hypothetical protein SNEBB_011260 [Seison nebaliae]